MPEKNFESNAKLTAKVAGHAMETKHGGHMRFRKTKAPPSIVLLTWESEGGKKEGGRPTEVGTRGAKHRKGSGLG